MSQGKYHYYVHPLLVGSPSPPRFDLSSPPQLDGNIVNLVWLPSADSGGDPEGLYYDVYAAQLNGEDPVFCRQNDEEIDCMCVCLHECTCICLCGECMCAIDSRCMYMIIW